MSFSSTPLGGVLEPPQAPGDLTPRDAFFRHMSHEIALRQATMSQLQKEISQLRRTQNSFAPVNRLAPELFAQIFKYLVDQTILKTGLTVKVSSGATRLRSLIWATHVCHYWREIALGAATLWTTFPIHKPSLALAFISRSRSAPLDLDLLLTDRHMHLYQIIEDILPPQISRLRTLILRARDCEGLRRIVMKLRLAAPKLEEIMIWQTTINLREEIPPMVDPSCPLFAGELPSLKTFSTAGVDVPLALRAPNALVQLNIHSNPSLADKALIDLLEQCPALESLKVKESDWFSSRRGPGYIGSSRPTVSLPHLKCLHLHFHQPQRAAALLHHIAVPKSTRFRIETFHDGLDSHGGYQMLPQNASENLKFLTGIKRLEVFGEVGTDETTDESVFTVRSYHDAVSYDDPEVEIRVRMAPWDLSGDFLAERWPFDVSQVETVVLSGLTHEPVEDAWLATLAEMDSVRTIRAVNLHPVVATDLASCLGETSNEAGDRPFALCPALSTLELVDMDGRGFVVDNSLKPMIVARAAAGTLKELELFNVSCFGPGSDDVKEIKEKCGSFITFRVDEVD